MVVKNLTVSIHIRRWVMDLRLNLLKIMYPMSLSSHALLAQVVNTKLQHAKKITNLLKDLCSQLRVLHLNKRFQMSHNMLVLQALLAVLKIRLAKEIIKFLEDLCNLFHN
jgi:hypothetical protein